MSTTYLPRSEIHKARIPDFRTPDQLAKRPWIGVLIAVLGLLVFGFLAYDLLHHGPINQWESSVENRMHTAALNSPVWVKAIMKAGFYVGLHGYIVIAVLLGLYFLFKRFWKEFLMVAVGCGGQGALWIGLANLFQRPRPEFEIPLGSSIPYPSFPSGHTMSGVIIFGLLAYMLVPRMTSRLAKAAIVVLALIMMLYIGFSRFFLGEHHLTDVVAGLAMGAAWTALVFTAIELFYRKGAAKHGKV